MAAETLRERANAEVRCARPNALWALRIFAPRADEPETRRHRAALARSLLAAVDKATLDLRASEAAARRIAGRGTAICSSRPWSKCPTI